jgi:membrane protease YdiL (CAAX protease family)
MDRAMKTSARLFAGVELTVLFCLWFSTVWAAWQWTGASVWTGCGFVAMAGIVAASVAIRRPDWKTSGFRLDNLGPALMEVSVVCFAVLSIFFLLIWEQGIAFEAVSNGGAIELVGSGMLQQAFFLGYLFQRWNALLLNPGAAVVANALVFAVIHLPHLFLVGLTVLGGLLLGVLFLRTRNVFAMGLAHGLLSALLIPTLRSAGVFVTTQIGPAELSALTAEVALQVRPGDRIGIGPHGIALRQLGDGLTVSVETLGDPSGPDELNRDAVLSFLKSRTRVFCLLSDEDFERYVSATSNDQVFLLGQRYVWKRQFEFNKKFVEELFLGAGDVPVLAAFRQQVLLFSNRPAA